MQHAWMLHGPQQLVLGQILHKVTRICDRIGCPWLKVGCTSTPHNKNNIIKCSGLRVPNFASPSLEGSAVITPVNDASTATHRQHWQRRLPNAMLQNYSPSLNLRTYKRGLHRTVTGTSGMLNRSLSCSECAAKSTVMGNIESALLAVPSTD